MWRILSNDFDGTDLHRRGTDRLLLLLWGFSTLVVVLCAATPVWADELSDGTPIESISGMGFTQSEADRLASALQLKVGGSIDIHAIDAGLRKLVQRGEVQSLFVESTRGRD